VKSIWDEENILKIQMCINSDRIISCSENYLYAIKKDGKYY